MHIYKDGSKNKKYNSILALINKLLHFQASHAKLIPSDSTLKTSNTMHVKSTQSALLHQHIQKLNNLIGKVKIPNQLKNTDSILLEVRAGSGGNEAGIFANDLLNMYLKFAVKSGWASSVLNCSYSFKKCLKEALVSMKGPKIYEALQYENGVHRVQRIPITESQGRIHTSACSVAVFTENTNEKMKIHSDDLRIDVFRSSGPGGQSVNTTDSAVRILHIPTGISTQCQNEKSQIRNKLAALKILHIKLEDFYASKKKQRRRKEKKLLVKSGDRSEKIRTYNFPQDRCTDHRVGETFYNIDKILSGNIGDILKSIREFYGSVSK